jgi:isopenicillin N synthase-like dioxygenase
MAILIYRRLDSSEIPVIDVAPLTDCTAAQAERTVGALGQVCPDIGFIYVRNHVVPRDLVARMADQTKLFFARPVDQKMKNVLDQRMRVMHRRERSSASQPLPERSPRTGRA